MALTELDYITINDEQIYKPTNFAPQIEDIYAGEYETCTGKRVGDRVGWRWSDMTLSWDALPQSMVDVLVNMSGAGIMTFDAPQGTYTESVIRTSAVQLRNRNTIRGEVWWRNVSVELRFINAHND